MATLVLKSYSDDSKLPGNRYIFSFVATLLSLFTATLLERINNKLVIAVPISLSGHIIRKDE